MWIHNYSNSLPMSSACQVMIKRWSQLLLRQTKIWLGGWCSKFEFFELPWWRVAQSCNMPNWYCIDYQDQPKHLTLVNNLFWSTCLSMP